MITKAWITQLSFLFFRSLGGCIATCAGGNVGGVGAICCKNTLPSLECYISRPPGRDLRDGTKAIRLLADGVLREKHWDIHSDSFRMGDRGNVLSHPPAFLSPARCPCPPQPGCEASIV